MNTFACTHASVCRLRQALADSHALAPEHPPTVLGLHIALATPASVSQRLRPTDSRWRGAAAAPQSCGADPATASPACLCRSQRQPSALRYPRGAHTCIHTRGRERASASTATPAAPNRTSSSSSISDSGVRASRDERAGRPEAGAMPGPSRRTKPEKLRAAHACKTAGFLHRMHDGRHSTQHVTWSTSLSACIHVAHACEMVVFPHSIRTCSCGNLPSRHVLFWTLGSMSGRPRGHGRNATQQHVCADAVPTACEALTDGCVECCTQTYNRFSESRSTRCMAPPHRQPMLRSRAKPPPPFPRTQVTC
eukprot:363534-Chlamydomonas_euryale.AAC.6